MHPRENSCHVYASWWRWSEWLTSTSPLVWSSAPSGCCRPLELQRTNRCLYQTIPSPQNPAWISCPLPPYWFWSRPPTAQIVSVLTLWLDFEAQGCQPALYKHQAKTSLKSITLLICSIGFALYTNENDMVGLAAHVSYQMESPGTTSANSS